MKIGIFSETFRPTINGVVVSIETFRDELEQRGHQFYIFAPFNKHALKSEARVFRFPAIHFHNDPVYPLAIPMPLWQAKNQLPLDVIKQLDVIHAQHFAMMGQYGLLLAKEFNIPSVYTYHTMAELYTSYVPIVGAAFDWPVRLWTRRTAGLADHIVAPTPSVKRYLRRIGVNQPISVVPTGIDISAYKRVSRSYLATKYDIPHDRQVLLYVGRMASEKNIDFLLNTFRLVNLANSSTHLLMVGGGPQKRSYEEQISRWGLAGHVTFTGFLPSGETKRLFGSADLFVFPSASDTQGIVILEAMASGTPCVAIDALGPHDIIDHNLTGRLVSLNLEKFVDTIIDLLRDDDKRLELAVGAKHAVKQYDKSATAAALEKVYESITNHPRS